jgi:hypothetical protein
MSEQKHDDNYHGNGRVSGALGKFSAYEIAALPVQMVGSGLAFSGNPALRTVGTVLAVAAIAAPFVGFVQGWNKAGTAIDEHAALVREVQELRPYKGAVESAVHQGLLKTEQTVSLRPA